MSGLALVLLEEYLQKRANYMSHSNTLFQKKTIFERFLCKNLVDSKLLCSFAAENHIEDGVTTKAAGPVNFSL